MGFQRTRLWLPAFLAQCKISNMFKQKCERVEGAGVATGEKVSKITPTKFMRMSELQTDCETFSVEWRREQLCQ